MAESMPRTADQRQGNPSEILRRASAAIREDCPIPEPSRALDFIDYPAAWALQNEGSTAHDERCSATQTGGAMLCDCEALLPPWVKWKTLLAVAHWLDALAKRAAHEEALPHPFTWPVEDEDVAALAVAETYLGEAGA